MRINNINTTSHKLSNDDWEQVKNNFGNGDHVNIHVMAFQTNTPTTGGFISQAFKLSHLIYTSINNGGAYSITGILNKQFTGSIEILDEYQGTPVTQISDSAFENCTSLTNINLPNSLTSIGNSAFKGCISLSSIAIPNSVTSIGQNAFSGCDSLIINWNNTTINIKTANINTTYIGALSIVNKYYWYEYIAPSSGEYSFKTTGTTDTYGELFTNMIYDDSTTGRITYDNNSGDGNNFLINHYLNTGQKVYLRVRGANPNVSGNFGFNINKIEHFHSYDIYDNYYDNLGHRVACICGHSIKEAHDTIIISGKYYCTICPWVGKNVIIIPEQFEDIFSVRFLDESKQRKMNLEETSIYNKKKKEAID